MKKFNFQPEVGLIIVNPLIVKPKETHGKTDILKINSTASKQEYQELVDVFDQHPFQAHVVKVGKQFRDEPIADVMEGDLVYLNRQLGQRDTVLINNKVYAYIRRSDIIGKVTPLINNKQN